MVKHKGGNYVIYSLVTHMCLISSLPFWFWNINGNGALTIYCQCTKKLLRHCHTSFCNPQKNDNQRGLYCR